MLKKQQLEKKYGCKMYNTAEFAEVLGFSHQRLSKLYNLQLKGEPVKLPLPTPIAKIGRANIWSEPQVAAYANNYRDHYKEHNHFHTRTIDGKEVYGKVCPDCGEFHSTDNYYYNSVKEIYGSSCKPCDNLKNAMEKRMKGKAVSPYKPRPRIIVTMANDGKRICPCCKEKKVDQAFRRGRTNQNYSVCNDCYNADRRERYAVMKGKVVV